MRNLLVIPILIFVIFSCKNENKTNQSIELKSDWQFAKKGDTTWHSATVPGVIHTDLLANKLIEAPFWETNELKLQWIENEDWNYKTIFNVTEKLLEYSNLELNFEGLDTYADVYLNGELLFKANNMFVAWKADVKNRLKVGGNLLEVKFTSPINKNKETVKNYPYSLPSGNETVDTKVYSFTRKAAYHFGWDWGPRFVTSGIWKKVTLNAWDSGRLTDVFIKTDSIVDDKAFLTFEANFESKAMQGISIDITIDDTVINILPEKNQSYCKHHFSISKPKLWWSNDLGEPHLYTVKTTLKDGNKAIDTKEQQFGVRTIELVNKKDSIGTSFYFKLNGVPVFAKGANYIPQDIFLPRVSPEQYKSLIKKAVDANMNMLRVWGGGIYEHDIFYELCDENGIMIWQDFMFANSLYPLEDEFFDNVKVEVAQNVKRLRKHPSIVIWCGNNEINVAWNNWGWQKQYGYSPKDSVILWNNYKKLFHTVIPEILHKLDKDANYVTTSPLSNWGKKENFNHSSMHYWGVWHGREPFTNFKDNVGRFMVEYGFQSFPEISTIKTFASDTSLNLESATVKNKQKSYIGNGLITKHINNWFDAPKSFEDFVDKSQKAQAIAYQTAIQAHRLGKPHCMGTLFWQLNDCWTGPSWSIIDYFGKEKAAYNTVKENYKPIIAVANIKNNTITILNDSNQKFEGNVSVCDAPVSSKSIIIKLHSRQTINYNFKKNKDRFKIKLLDSNKKVIFSDVIYTLRS